MMEEFKVCEFNDIKNVYSHLSDEISKNIFLNRFLYKITGDIKYLQEILFPIAWKRDYLLELFNGLEDKNIIFWGAGRDLNTFRILCPNINVNIICDKCLEKQKNGYLGIKVISPDELFMMKNIYVAISSSAYHLEIRDELLKHNFPSEKIIDIGGILLEMHKGLDRIQYFDKEIITPVDNEVFIDGGCFDCTTDLAFREWCNGKYESIYAFEPDNVNFNNCKEISKENQIENIEIINAGLWSENTTLSFIADHGRGARIGEDYENTINIKTRTIDSVVKGERVTFIKMDIEGAELEALKGAENTIKKWHPRLAICIYHKPEDIFDIPAYILSLHEDYKLYIRHYQLTECETVLYCV